jgi:hypothetical protein
MLQVFHRNVASVLETCCKRLFKMFHLFANVFDVDVSERVLLLTLVIPLNYYLYIRVFFKKNW